LFGCRRAAGVSRLIENAMSDRLLNQPAVSRGSDFLYNIVYLTAITLPISGHFVEKMA